MAEVIALRKTAYASEPFFDEQIAFFVRAWNQLGTCRAIGMVAGPIPWTATEQWCTAEALDDDARELVHDVITYLDGLRAESEHGKAEVASLKKSPQPQRRRR